MSIQKIEDAFQKVSKALTALETILKKPIDKDRANIDASIQRFEFTVELFWKLLKRLLEAKGVEVVFPKDVLRKAYQGKLIDNEKIWLAMLQDRNLTFHTYNEQLADEIYQHIQTYYPVLQKTYDTLHTEWKKIA